MDTRPYFLRRKPTPQVRDLFGLDRIDLTSAYLPPYQQPDPSGNVPDSRPQADSIFNARAAAAVAATLGGSIQPLEIGPSIGNVGASGPYSIPAGSTQVSGILFFVDSKSYPGTGAGDIFILNANCLAAMAYADYFHEDSFSFGNLAPLASLRSTISQVITTYASPGWCGSFGPSDEAEGNYDFNQMFILALVYNFYDVLTPQAQDRAVMQLLANGRIRRPNLDDTLTSGVCPDDWTRAGYVSLAGLNVGDYPETENHVLMIATARYLTNQLLYQRDQNPAYDNRRNGKGSRPNCIDQVLGLLRNQLRDDFAEYNAKNYQEETRHALLNLCSYAYDAEVRLGARMVLDYVSAHIAVSSNDLRRMVPFRRRNETYPEVQSTTAFNSQQSADHPGFMDNSLLDAHGADPMSAQFALLAGNTRAYQHANTRQWPDDSGKTARPWDWAITPNFAPELTLGALSTYRLPPSIHDLFVNDLHRRFFQRLHRRFLSEEYQRNCDNMEIYCGSPSYLITAGGRPAEWVIPGKQGIPKSYQSQNLGVAVPTSFMPTGQSAGADVSPNDSNQLIQFCRFSDKWADPSGDQKYGGTENYGVAPDFACGFGYYLPPWVANAVPHNQDGVPFFYASPGNEPPGFYLAFYKSGDFILMEAFDTWLHAADNVTFAQFQSKVKSNNRDGVNFKSGQEAQYTTYYGNVIHFVIWNNNEIDNHMYGAKIMQIDYAPGQQPIDTLSDAGNYDPNTSAQFLSGSVLTSPVDGKVEIRNRILGTTLTLDWSDGSINPYHLVRTSETGEMEQAGVDPSGLNYEVWLDFAWTGPMAGDFFRPFNTLAAAIGAVADGGVIKIVPGTTTERPVFRHDNKRFKLMSPFGNATIGSH